eukprot:GHVO01022930.1.p1 GENE.GHVO01022930.1~~GHVO01022930.1.p1  ORF type:complete len:1307 (+),score=265.62 GHVO01022930.1:1-3921(+)
MIPSDDFLSTFNAFFQSENMSKSYIAPERLLQNAEPPVDPVKVDVYSMGCAFLEMCLGGVRPADYSHSVESANWLQRRSQSEGEGEQAPNFFEPFLSRISNIDMGQWIARMIHIDPTQRPSSLQLMREVLQSHMKSKGVCQGSGGSFLPCCFSSIFSPLNSLLLHPAFQLPDLKIMLIRSILQHSIEAMWCPKCVGTSEVCPKCMHQEIAKLMSQVRSVDWPSMYQSILGLSKSVKNDDNVKEASAWIYAYMNNIDNNECHNTPLGFLPHVNEERGLKFTNMMLSLYEASEEKSKLQMNMDPLFDDIEDRTSQAFSILFQNNTDQMINNNNKDNNKDDDNPDNNNTHRNDDDINSTDIPIRNADSDQGNCECKDKTEFRVPILPPATIIVSILTNTIRHISIVALRFMCIDMFSVLSQISTHDTRWCSIIPCLSQFLDDPSMDIRAATISCLTHACTDTTDAPPWVLRRFIPLTIVPFFQNTITATDSSWLRYHSVASFIDWLPIIQTLIDRQPTGVKQSPDKSPIKPDGPHPNIDALRQDIEESLNIILATITDETAIIICSKISSIVTFQGTSNTLIDILLSLLERRCTSTRRAACSGVLSLAHSIQYTVAMDTVLPALTKTLFDSDSLVAEAAIAPISSIVSNLLSYTDQNQNSSISQNSHDTSCPNELAIGGYVHHTILEVIKNLPKFSNRFINHFNEFMKAMSRILPCWCTYDIHPPSLRLRTPSSLSAYDMRDDVYSMESFVAGIGENGQADGKPRYLRLPMSPDSPPGSVHPTRLLDSEMDIDNWPLGTLRKPHTMNEAILDIMKNGTGNGWKSIVLPQNNWDIDIDPPATLPPPTPPEASQFIPARPTPPSDKCACRSLGWIPEGSLVATINHYRCPNKYEKKNLWVQETLDGMSFFSGNLGGKSKVCLWSPSQTRDIFLRPDISSEVSSDGGDVTAFCRIDSIPMGIGIGRQNGMVDIMKYDTGAELVGQLDLAKHSSWPGDAGKAVTALASSFLPCGLVASGHKDGHVYCWDTRTLKAVMRFTLPTVAGTPTRMKFDSFNRVLHVSTSGSSIRTFDLRASMEIQNITLKGGRAIMDFSPWHNLCGTSTCSSCTELDGSMFIAVGGTSNSVIWVHPDMNSNNILSIFRADNNAATDIDKLIHIQCGMTNKWDSDMFSIGEIQAAYTALDGVRSLHVPNITTPGTGAFICSGSADGCVRRWCLTKVDASCPLIGWTSSMPNIKHSVSHIGPTVCVREVMESKPEKQSLLRQVGPAPADPYHHDAICDIAMIRGGGATVNNSSNLLVTACRDGVIKIWR